MLIGIFEKQPDLFNKLLDSVESIVHSSASLIVTDEERSFLIGSEGDSLGLELSFDSFRG